MAFVSGGQLCGAALLIAENTGTKFPLRDNFRHYIVAHDMEVQLCKVAILYSVKYFMTKTV